MICLVVFYHSS